MTVGTFFMLQRTLHSIGISLRRVVASSSIMYLTSRSGGLVGVVFFLVLWITHVASVSFPCFAINASALARIVDAVSKTTSMYSSKRPLSLNLSRHVWHTDM